MGLARPGPSRLDDQGDDSEQHQQDEPEQGEDPQDLKHGEERCIVARMPKSLTSIAVVIIAVWMILTASTTVSTTLTTILGVVAGVLALIDVLEPYRGRIRR